MNRFRPQTISKTYIMKLRRLSGRKDSYNWQSRVEWYPAVWGKHQQQFARRFSRLHYLACHAPVATQRRWQPVYRAFMNRHFGDSGKASMRYLNKWSCHSWL